MSRQDKHGEGCWECAAGSAFRRSTSLRLRGERPMFPQQRASSGGAVGGFPSISEHPRRQRADAARPDARPQRQRSFSLRASSGLKAPTSPILNKTKCQTCPNSYMEGASEADAATPPGSPEDLPDDDSLHSYSSAMTANSCDNGYAPYNGTTFSGRSMRYVLHCSSHAGLSGDEYLTPTQRAQKQIRRLKNLLSLARKDLESKDSEILVLTKEVVELKLYKASLCSPDDKSNSSEILTVRESAGDSADAGASHESYDAVDGPYEQTPRRQVGDMQSSFTDSGHFEDLATSSLHSKDSSHAAHDSPGNTEAAELENERRKLIEYYEKKIEDMVRSHASETQDLKKQHNDKVETLLQKLADVNTHYGSLLPDYEAARERIHALERQLGELHKQLADEEEKHRGAYVAMYNKGMEVAKLDAADKELAEGPANRVSVSQLLEQLQITQTELDNVRAMYRRIVDSQATKSPIDPEVTLQFLKSAVYYFLTDPENHQGHLNAIESILGFSDSERSNIRKARSS